ncbi:stearoyl-CoA desaturase 5-like [Saccoglossus kowalevskii]|uniref:Stearoyl-CoA desaturase 5-like n=1 Tax=Saccoglossus kowalevskii TaxID=10224 RepID=A0ABM0GXZ2_SACKO|nr:PREDICTED: stearoyl-CoA desaturase 5-like [Saccoglossus kowalevskii]
MAPRNDVFQNFEEEDSASDSSTTVLDDVVQTENVLRVPVKIVWRNVVLMGALHLAALYSLFLIPSCRWQTLLFGIVLMRLGGLGITAGAHRLWAHRSYKARFPLRVFLALIQTLAFQNDIFEWSRDHRVHHKYSETDADPHNAKRGFFFAHVGWLLSRKHPDVIRKGRSIDLSDLHADPVVRFQRRVYKPAVLLLCFIIPTLLPTYWDESVWNSFYICALLRYTLSLHATWCVNSVAHMFGNKPYDRYINPTENMMVVLGALGEGFHNFHHTFPSDYAAAEFGIQRCNTTKMLIDIWCFLGLAYDRKSTSIDVVKKRKIRTGDGTNHTALLYT